MAAHTTNTIVIDAPFQLVWDITNDVANWTSLYTEYAKAEILERDGDTVTFRLTMHPDENGMVWSWVSERTSNLETKSVAAHRVETGPFEFMNIRWTYAEEPDGVRMTWIQDFDMKPAAPVNNSQMTDRLNTNSKIQMDIIKDKIEAAARTGASTTA
ncbi:MAG TPA: SRPBCC family protein [Pseudonocardiaceae bacterium]|jgi:aromatase|nr:SRPBCC family protein [Pseudonocardiaceae bacterium]